MTDKQKQEVEKKISDLTAVYLSFLTELASIHDKREEIREQLKKEDQSFESVSILTDCVLGRLNEAKKVINALYNNEDPIPLNKFVFDRSMVQKIDQTEADN